MSSVVRIHLAPQDSDRKIISGSSSVGRATAFQAVGRGFEPRLPLWFLKKTKSKTPLPEFIFWFLKEHENQKDFQKPM
jgi:hypothetical protein